MIKLRVFELKVSLLDKCRDLLKLVVSILTVVKQDAIEDLGQVRVEVLGHVPTDILGCTQLVLDPLQRLLANTHPFTLIALKN